MERIRQVCRAIRPWVDRFHLRNKSLSARELYRWGESLLKNGFLDPGQLVINNRTDVALALGCAGVHLPETGLPVASVKAWAGDRLEVGCSVHSPAAAQKKASEGADYLFFGHVFPSASKPGQPAKGMDELKRVVASVSVPVMAIGGITPEKARWIRETGCAGVAVISAVMNVSDPGQAAWRLKSFMAGQQSSKKGEGSR